MARFVGASRRRAAERRRERPELARQARAWSAIGTAAWIAPAAAGVEPFRGRLHAGLAWWGLVALMLDWHLGMVESEEGEPRPLGPADACTLARAWLAPLAAHRPGPLVCGAGFASDALDGTLARAGTPTRAGRDLEGLADAAFALAALRGAVRNGWLGSLPAGAEAARLLAGFAITSAAYFRPEGPGPVPRGSKAASFVRAGGLIAAGLGRRRVADVLVSAGAAIGVLTGTARSRAAPSAPLYPATEAIKSG